MTGHDGGLTTQTLPQKINLGCGDDKRDGWWNVDVDETRDPDQVINLDHSPWNLPSNHFEYALASHVVEHLGDVDAAFEEAARILVDLGTLEVRMPLGRDARTDPTHRREWTYDTPEFYSCAHRRSWGPDTDFKLVAREVRGWFVGPHYHLNPVLDRLAPRWPRLVETWSDAGELVAVFQRCPR